MLQQTQVKTVLPYFKKFTKKFPTLESLSKSNEKQILKMWEGLGYYRRARNLYACSNQLINFYKGKLPKTLDEIRFRGFVIRFSLYSVDNKAHCQQLDLTQKLRHNNKTNDSSALWTQGLKNRDQSSLVKNGRHKLCSGVLDKNLS